MASAAYKKGQESSIVEKDGPNSIEGKIHLWNYRIDLSVFTVKQWNSKEHSVKSLAGQCLFLVMKSYLTKVSG